MLLSATVLGLAGCVNAEKPAAPGAGNSVSYGNPPSSQPAPTTPPASAPANPSAPPPSGQSATATRTAEHHNTADVTFTKQAVPLRQQAVTMANAAVKSSTDSRVRALAAQIAKDNVSVSTMNAWLSQWGQVAAVTRNAGVLSTSQLNQLVATKGISFDMKWLQFMRSNLNAARQAATTEQSKGSSPQVKQLAKQWASALKTESSRLSAIG